MTTARIRPNGRNIAAAAVFCLLAGATQANAQSVNAGPPPSPPQMIKVLYVVVPPPPSISTVSAIAPTAPPSVPTATIPTTPPPVVVTPPVMTPPVMTPPVAAPTPPRMPDRPGMFTNIPADLRGMNGLSQLTSIDRLLTAPGTVAISVPRQAKPNLLENRPSASMAAPATTGALDATRALDNAKSLL